MIETKFKINDTVYYGHYHSEGIKIKCPDCLGTTEWEITTPAGEKFNTECGTCYSGWENKGTIFTNEYTPLVQKLTVGSIQIDTAGNEEDRIRYMCHETGIGSGQIYSEKSLFLTEIEATEEANTIVKKLQDRKDEFDLERLRQSKQNRRIKRYYRADEMRNVLGIVRRLENKIKELTK